MLLAPVAPGTAMTPARQRILTDRRRLPRPAEAPATPAGSTVDPSRDELIATIRAWEGEAVDRPPLLFKATVALGSATLAATGLLALGFAV